MIVEVEDLAEVLEYLADNRRGGECLMIRWECPREASERPVREGLLSSFSMLFFLFFLEFIFAVVFPLEDGGLMVEGLVEADRIVLDDE